MDPLNDGNRARLPMVFVERIRCPRCCSKALTTTHSRAQGDGSVLRYTKCRDCHGTFKVIIE